MEASCYPETSRDTNGLTKTIDIKVVFNAVGQFLSKPYSAKTPRWRLHIFM